MTVPASHTLSSWLSSIYQVKDEATKVTVLPTDAIPVGHTRFSFGVETDETLVNKARGLNKVASLFRKRGNLQQALGLYKAAIEVDYSAVLSHFNLGCIYDDLKNYEDALHHFRVACVIAPLFKEAVNCYAGLTLRYRHSRGDLQDAARVCMALLKVNPACAEAQWNLGSVLRRCGQRHLAIKQAWMALGVPSVEPVIVSNQAPLSPKEECITIVCVKWGTKYDAGYVNKLYNGCSRNLPKDSFKFVCFTEDGAGIVEECMVHSLPFSNWEGWWNKASVLFSPFLSSRIQGRIMYIDLDTVITGSLVDIAKYNGEFGILGTDDFTKSEGRVGGYNSSVVMYDCQNEKLHKIFHMIQEIGLEKLQRFVHRFDFWLEMLVEGADVLQQAFPGQLIDYKTHVMANRDKLPPNACIVNFPLEPKPHNCTHVEWIKRCWI